MAEVGTAEYFRELRESGNNKFIEVLESTLRPHQVTTPGHEIPIETVSKRTRIGQIARLASESGWDVKVGESAYYSGDRLVKSTSTVKEGKDETWQWLQGVKDGHRFELSSNTCLFDNKPVDFIQLKIKIEEAQ